MGQKRSAAPGTSAGADLSAAAAAVDQAAQDVAASAAQMREALGQTSPGTSSPGAAGENQPPTRPVSAGNLEPRGHDDEAREFYERLRQTGQLVDVDGDTDLSTLPSRITHVRLPDGTVERVGFSGAPLRQV